MKSSNSPTKTTRRSPRSSTAAGAGPRGRSLRPPRYGIGFADHSRDRLEPGVQATMEAAFGADFSGVRIHEDGEAAKLGALAITRGPNLHFAPGKYDPHTLGGRELIGHELAHVVQQAQGRVAASFQAKGLAINDDPKLEAQADAIGARAARGERVADLGGADLSAGFGQVTQCYLDGKLNATSWRVADDLDMMIRQDTSNPAYGSHVFYALSSLISSSSATLKAQTSRLELTAGAETKNVTNGKTTKTLNRVIPKNLKDKSKGNDASTGMQWPDDCGYAANSVMQGDKRKTKAVYSDPKVGSTHETSTLNYATDEVKYRGATLYTPHMMLDEILEATLDPDPVQAWKKYQKMTAKEKDEFDRKVGINKYANPEIGEALSIVSNKDEYVEGKSAWNFHWGGVCMKSGSDYVTMENFAGSGGSAWDFQMYGSASKPGQTFHEQQESRTHHSTGKDEYGPNPTTIRVRPG